jgi:hypothetical protein
MKLRMKSKPDDDTVIQALAAVDQPTAWTDPNADLRDEADQQRIRAEMAEQERDELRVERDEYHAAATALNAELDRLMAGMDTLAGHYLPQLPGARPVDVRPAAPVLYDTLAAETGFVAEPADAWVGSVGD